MDLFSTSPARMEIGIKGVGKARPRVISKGGKSWSFMPKEYTAWKKLVKSMSMASKTIGALCKSGLPVELVAIFGFELPQKIDRKFIERQGMDWEKGKTREHWVNLLAGRWCPNKRPDTDNLVGSLMDAMIEDDGLVVSALPAKVWSANGSYIKFCIDLADPLLSRKVNLLHELQVSNPQTE